MTKGKIRASGLNIIQKESAAISALEAYINDAFVNAVQMIATLQRETGHQRRRKERYHRAENCGHPEFYGHVGRFHACCRCHPWRSGHGEVKKIS